jgi:hypothetical protein
MMIFWLLAVFILTGFLGRNTNFALCIKDRYEKIKIINNSVALRGNKSILRVFWSTLTIIFTIMYISICQKLNKTVIKVDRNYHEITHVINGKLVRILIKTPKGPRNILQIIDQKDEDVTEEIESYFLTKPIFLTPKYLGYKNLAFNMDNGDTFDFDFDDTITFEKDLVENTSEKSENRPKLD